MLAALFGRTGNRTPMIQWVPQVTILPAPHFQRGANPSQLETRGREARTRTSSACPQNRSAHPYATSRWRKPCGEGRNRTGSTALAGRARHLACHPHDVDRPGFEPGNLRLAEAALCQLELAAQRGAASGTGLSRVWLAHLPPHRVNFTAGWRLPQMLTLWRCQKACPYKGQAGTAGVEPAFRPGWSRAA
jgi:hypothetical protein